MKSAILSLLFLAVSFASAIPMPQMEFVQAAAKIGRTASIPTVESVGVTVGRTTSLRESGQLESILKGTDSLSSGNTLSHGPDQISKYSNANRYLGQTDHNPLYAPVADRSGGTGIAFEELSSVRANLNGVRSESPINGPVAESFDGVPAAPMKSAPSSPDLARLTKLKKNLFN